jgi:hypothetical protein
MPNRHSGGFTIETSDLHRLIEAASDTASMGTLVDGSQTPKLRPVGAAELLRLLEASHRERLGVEQQDRTFYIIHIRDGSTPIWVSVKPDSPIFGALTQRHAQWAATHQDHAE